MVAIQFIFQNSIDQIEFYKFSQVLLCNCIFILCKRVLFLSKYNLTKNSLLTKRLPLQREDLETPACTSISPPKCFVTRASRLMRPEMLLPPYTISPPHPSSLFHHSVAVACVTRSVIYLPVQRLSARGGIQVPTSPQ